LNSTLFGPLNSYFKNQTSACKITRYRMARLIALAWIKVASVGAVVSTFELTGTYTLNYNRVTEYLFSMSDTIDKMATAPPNMSVVCVSFSNQLSKCVTYLSRTFIKCSE
jgi:hypothetical protein